MVTARTIAAVRPHRSKDLATEDEPDRCRGPAELLAPPWHTGALIALMVAVGVTGTLLEHAHAPLASAHPGSRILGTYLPLLVVNVGLTFYACRVGRPRSALRSLLGRGWNSAGRACADLALASAAWMVIEGVEAAFATWRKASVVALLPQSEAERIVWVLVATTVAFCEEVVYRGYLQTQLTAFTRRASFAIGIQALLFGLAHGEQGLAVVVRFAFYGAMLGALARWRRSLIPGIACHLGIDVVSGLVHV